MSLRIRLYFLLIKINHSPHGMSLLSHNANVPLHSSSYYVFSHSLQKDIAEYVLSEQSCTSSYPKVFPYPTVASRFNQYFINHYMKQNVFHISLLIIDLLIVLPRVFFLISLNMFACQFLFAFYYFHMHACQCNGCNQRFSGCLLDKTWENQVMLFLHGQLALDIRPRCWPRVLKLTCLQLVNFEHPLLTSLLNIQCYLIMTQWITFEHHTQ